jgi:hypothetical protein
VALDQDERQTFASPSQRATGRRRSCSPTASVVWRRFYFVQGPIESSGLLLCDCVVCLCVRCFPSLSLTDFRYLKKHSHQVVREFSVGIHDNCPTSKEWKSPIIKKIHVITFFYILFAQHNFVRLFLCMMAKIFRRFDSIPIISLERQNGLVAGGFIILSGDHPRVQELPTWDQKKKKTKKSL